MHQKKIDDFKTPAVAVLSQHQHVKDNLDTKQKAAFNISTLIMNERSASAPLFYALNLKYESFVFIPIV